MNRTAVVICPGRGTYNKSELGYLKTHHKDQSGLLNKFDAKRREAGQHTLAELDDAAQYSPRKHSRGDNAASLIFSSSLFDFNCISDDFDVVAVTGNSMGWYTALATSGAADPVSAFEIVNTMGTLMHEHMIGGQSLYPFVDENWVPIPGLRAELLDLIDSIGARPDHRLAVSINLGGMLVAAGDETGLAAFEAGLPQREDRYPMRLRNHAAFHTALQEPVAAQARSVLPLATFDTPKLPLVDGRGHVWYPRACIAQDLRDYTLGHQVVEPYDFSKAVQTAARCFAPDVFIVTGPGETMGGAVIQALIQIEWKGMSNKTDFQGQQKVNPVLLSMGRAQDRKLVVNGY